MSWRASAYIKALRVCPNGESLTRSEKLVGYALADSHQDRGETHTYPSVEALAEDSLMTKRECQRILASLECKGVIQRVRPAVQFRGMTTFYLFPQLDRTSERVTPEPPLKQKKDDTQTTLKGGSQATLYQSGRVTEGCQKGDISRTVYKEEQEQVTKTNTKPLVAPVSFSVPEWVPAGPWNSFLEMRRKMRAPMTERAMELAVKTLALLQESGHSPGEVLDQSTFRGWKGLFPLKAGESNAGSVKYTDPASVYESPEYQGIQRSA